MDDLTIVTCNYDTPDLITNLLVSITKHCEVPPEVLVVSTGKFPLLDSWKPLWKNYYIPNSAHGPAVNKSFELVTTDYILLLDSDVLLRKDVSHIFDKFKKSGAALLGNVSGDRGGKRLHPRVDPWFCMMNLKLLKEHGIIFFDSDRTKESRGTEVVYDVGSTMFEDVMKADLKVINFNGDNDYFRHYEGMSWRVGKYDPTKEDTDIDFGGTHNNKALYDYGLLVENVYQKDVANL